MKNILRTAAALTLALAGCAAPRQASSDMREILPESDLYYYRASGAEPVRRLQEIFDRLDADFQESRQADLRKRTMCTLLATCRLVLLRSGLDDGISCGVSSVRAPNGEPGFLTVRALTAGKPGDTLLWRAFSPRPRDIREELAELPADTAAAFAVGFLVLAFRLKMVQVDGAADATDGLRRQSIRRVQTEGVRGRILDCRGRVLADNRPSGSIVLNAGVFRQATWDETAAAITNALAAVADVVGRPSPLTERDIRRHLRQNLARPLTVWRDVDADALARFEEQDFRLPGYSADGARPSGFAVAESALMMKL